MTNLLYIHADFPRGSRVAMQLIDFYSTSQVERLPGLESVVTMLFSNERQRVLEGTPTDFSQEVEKIPFRPERRGSIALLVTWSNYQAATDFYRSEVYKNFMGLAAVTSANDQARYTLVRMNEQSQPPVSVSRLT